MKINKIGRFSFYWFLISVPVMLNIKMHDQVFTNYSILGLVVFWSGITCGILSPFFSNKGIVKCFLMLIVTIIAMFCYLVLWSILLGLMGSSLVVG
jgi:hypothetical protein